MNQNDNKDFENEDNPLKDVYEYQRNMYNPGHYIGTGRIHPTVSAPGNPTFLAVLGFLGAVLTLAFGLLLFFSDNISVTSLGIIESELANKIIVLVTMLALSAFFAVLGIAYFKKARKYYRQKAEMEKMSPDDSVEDKMLQRTCPKCNKDHDIDYPKCPHCNFNYME